MQTDLDKEIQFLSQACKFGDNFTQVRRCEKLINVGEYQLALKDAEYVLSSTKDISNGYIFKARALCGQLKIEQALETLQQAVGKPNFRTQEVYKQPDMDKFVLKLESLQKEI